MKAVVTIKNNILLIRVLILITFLNVSCNKHKKINYYPRSLKNEVLKYDINDSFVNDNLITKDLKEITKKPQNNVPYFKIEDDSTINYVQLALFWNSHSKYFDNLHINSDSIWFKGNHSLGKLDSILPLHYFNYGKLHYASKNPQRASIMIKVDTTSKLKDLETKYSKILNSYKKSIEGKNDSTDLLIKWNFLNFISPPPPPPSKKD
ncbi:hypothetical protein J4050_15120 [Winogradskyella sp. DF17]|uniref:Lipoprotein n=1 Tax=Winogradskyella pelagia TaxID=2819984 RepID=A0ABS3T5P9_9FLAO|nr:hypothetical protein [Winogradskyella sp. DF17]MBO3118082.1 hypothetical protein [Winogradskyella sp. DF17]